MNGTTAEQNGQTHVGRNLSGLLHDLLTLGELQTQLVAVDLQEAKSQSVVPIAVIVAAILLALGTTPVVLLGIGWALVNFARLTEGAAFLLVSVTSLVVIGVMIWWAVGKLQSAFQVMSRSRQELTENVRWIKQSLLQQGTNAAVYRRRV